MPKKPTARKENLLIQKIGPETLIYDLMEDKAFCLNPTSATIWELCDGHKTLGQIRKEATAELGMFLDEGFLWLALDQLNKFDLIETAPELPPEYSSFNRREIIKRIGLASAAALPLISSLVAPRPINAASSVCTPNPEAGGAGLGGFCNCVNTPTSSVGDNCGTGDAGFNTCKSGCTCSVTAVFPISTPNNNGTCG